MDQTLVASVAGDYARQHDYDIALYEVSSVVKEDETYLVMFQGRSGRPGDHFTVRVDAFSGRAIELVPGE